MLKKTRTVELNRDALSDEAVTLAESWARVNNIAVMDDIFWNDFLLGAYLWGLYCGCIGEM